MKKSLKVCILTATIAYLSTRARCDFDDEDIKDTYTLRTGNLARCAASIKITDKEEDDTRIQSTELKLDGQACTGGEIKLVENPSGSNATRFFKVRKKQFDDFVAGNVSMADIVCRTSSLQRFEEMIFVKPEALIEVQWSQVFGNEMSDLQKDGQGFTFASGEKYLIVSSRCVYSQTRLVDRFCFPSSGRVNVHEVSASGKAVVRRRAMANLQIGDVVDTGGGTKSKIVLWTHRKADVWTTYVRATTRFGSVTATRAHFVYMDGGQQLIAMRDVVVGTNLTVWDGSGAVVNSVSNVVLKGFWNPHTENGQIVVDGFLASCYTSVVSISLAHALLAPVRAMRHMFDAIGQFNF